MNQPPQVVFFIDRALESKRLIQSMRSKGAAIETHQAHFPHDACDVEWLPIVSKKGWVVLTQDANLGRNQIELTEIAKENTKVFILVSGNLGSQAIALLLTNILEKLEKFALNNSSPFIAKIKDDGSITLWRNHTQLLKLLS
jgi:predicted nuclease of predicted toxin-antitoxin system